MQFIIQDSNENDVITTNKKLVTNYRKQCIGVLRQYYQDTFVYAR